MGDWLLWVYPTKKPDGNMQKTIGQKINQLNI